MKKVMCVDEQAFLELPAEEQSDILQTVAPQLGRSAAVMEKCNPPVSLGARCWPISWAGRSDAVAPAFEWPHRLSTPIMSVSP